MTQDPKTANIAATDAGRKAESPVAIDSDIDVDADVEPRPADPADPANDIEIDTNPANPANPAGDGNPSEMLTARTESLAAANVLCSHFDVPGVQKTTVDKAPPKTYGPTDWIGDSIPKADVHGGTRMCHDGFVRDGMQVTVGDFVSVLASNADVQYYIGMINELYDSVSGDAEDGVGASANRLPAKMALIQWYQRPEELDLDGSLDVFPNEVFRVDEHADVPLDMVVGKCRIVSPKEFWDSHVLSKAVAATNALEMGSPISSMSPLSPLSPSLESDLYVCSKEYLREDRRIVPLEDVPDDVPLYARDYRLENGVLIPKHKPKAAAGEKTKGKRGTKVAKANQVGEDGKPKRRTTKRSKAAAAVAALARTEANGGAGIGNDGPDGPDDPDDPDGRMEGVVYAQGTNAGANGAHTARRPPTKETLHESDEGTEAAPKPVKRSRNGRVIKEPVDRYTTRDYSGDKEVVPISKKRVDTAARNGKYGRWSQERYMAAQKNLVDAMRLIGATHPHKAVLRPFLREQARKSVGDTGLLDYLLKNLTDSVVSEEGERLRRRHNATGHMEYWLQDPKSADEENKMVKDEMSALSAELRQVREARNLLQTVREVVEDVKTEVGSPKQSKGAKGALNASFHKDLSDLKAEHEAHAKRSEEEIKVLKDKVEMLESKVKELIGVVEEVKVKGNLDVAMDDVLYGRDE